MWVHRLCWKWSGRQNSQKGSAAEAREWVARIRLTAIGTRHACSREPGILLMSDNELALRLLALKAAVPRLNIQELVRRRPQVLRNKVGSNSGVSCCLLSVGI